MWLNYDFSHLSYQKHFPLVCRWIELFLALSQPEKVFCLFPANHPNVNVNAFSFVSRCSHVWCRSRRFDCILLVFFRPLGRLVMRDLIKHDALLWLVVFSTALIGAFRSSVVRCRTALLLLCFLIVGVHASGISSPLSLLMLLGWSLMWIASWPCACSNESHD